jgi:hypothetical protein
MYNVDGLDADHDGLACENGAYTSYGVSSSSARDDNWIPPDSPSDYYPDPDFDDEPRAPTVDEIKDMVVFWAPIVGVVFGVLVVLGLIVGAVQWVRGEIDPWNKLK